MEPWRAAATALTTLLGLAMVMSNRTKKLDSPGEPPGAARRATLGGLAVLAVFDLLTATALPAQLCWALLAAGVLISSVLMVTG